jgi:hypothetical protein
MTYDDFERLSELNQQTDGKAMPEPVLETTIDKAFPFLFGKGG